MLMSACADCSSFSFMDLLNQQLIHHLTLYFRSNSMRAIIRVTFFFNKSFDPKTFSWSTRFELNFFLLFCFCNINKLFAPRY